MKIETRSGVNFNSLFFSIKIPFMKKKLNISMNLFNPPETWVSGYSSRTMNGTYVLFHDYDNLALEDIKAELKFLQTKFNLSDYYLFKLDRENSYHAVNLDTFTLAKAYEIQKTTSCDLAFIESVNRLTTKEWILRLGKKGDRNAPIYCGKVKSSFDSRIKSKAHAVLLKKLGVPIDLTKGKWDNQKTLGLVKYNTANRIK